VIVYVGAVAVLFLFVVMMIDIDFKELRRGMKQSAPVGALVGGVLLGEMIWMYLHWPVKAEDLAAQKAPVDAPVVETVSNTHALGRVLYTEYVYLFQLAGLILLVAMIGAIVLTLRKRPGVRRQDVSAQINRKASDVLKVEKITTGTGVS